MSSCIGDEFDVAGEVEADEFEEKIDGVFEAGAEGGIGGSEG